MVYQRICKWEQNQTHNYPNTHVQIHNTTTLLVVKIKVNIVKILFGEYIDNDFYFSLVKCLKWPWDLCLWNTSWLKDSLEEPGPNLFGS